MIGDLQKRLVDVHGSIADLIGYGEPSEPAARNILLLNIQMRLSVLIADMGDLGRAYEGAIKKLLLEVQEIRDRKIMDIQAKPRRKLNGPQLRVIPGGREEFES